jgi:hypothetical protein
MMPKTYSTPEAAKLIGVSVITGHRWLAAGKIRPFGIELADGRKLWRWNDRDIRRAQAEGFAETRSQPVVKPFDWNMDSFGLSNGFLLRRVQ